jgi:Tn7-like transposition protein D/TniQ
MVSFLPPLHSDELLYSLLARFHWLTCSESPKHTLDELFGNRYVHAGVALQTNLANLCANFPPQRKLTPEKLTRDATLFPYLTAFQPCKVRDWALTKLSEGNAESVCVRLGLAAGVVRLPECLRYCPACCSAMLSISGEFYWMRAHQLPGVLVCPIHQGVPLADSMVHPAEANRHEYIAADETNCPQTPPYPAWTKNPSATKLLHDIATASTTLTTNPPQARSLNAWGEYYRAALSMRGFGKGSTNINQESLRDAYMTHFGPILSILPETAPDLWLEGMPRKHRKAVAPLRHILLHLLIEALPLSRKTVLFGYGPWPCRNPLAEHYGQAVVASCCTHNEGGKTIGVFNCSCGYTFSQAAASGSKIRILNLGPSFSVRLRELLTIGTGLRATARALAVDPNTIRRYIDKLGLVSPWKPRSRQLKVHASDREIVRARWSVACRDNPDLSRTQLRFVLPSEYAWLYRHDRDWLESQPPNLKHQHGGSQRRDWPSIDRKMAAELREGAARMRTETPPIRITRAAIERLLGKPEWLDKRLNKLPLCALAVAKLTESVAAFQCRRIAWAVDELHRLDQPVTTWRLRRVAGLHDHCALVVEAALSAAEKRA